MAGCIIVNRVGHKTDPMRFHLREVDKGLHDPIGNNCRNFGTTVIDQIYPRKILFQEGLYPSYLSLDEYQAGDSRMFLFPDMALLPFEYGSLMDKNIKLLAYSFYD
jgi:hypothetical protein